MLYLIVIIILIIFLFCFFLFTYLLKNKIERLEKIIILELEKRTNLIPTLYEISKKYIQNYEEVFNEILILRKKEFNSYNEEFISKIFLETFIHKELNFIFKIILKNPKIEKNSVFLILRDLFTQNSYTIWKKVELYKKIIFIYNKNLKYKNYTLIWYFLNYKIKKWIN